LVRPTCTCTPPKPPAARPTCLGITITVWSKVCFGFSVWMRYTHWLNIL
jgi:hypothetical protein